MSKEGIRLRTSTEVLRLLERTADDLLEDKIDDSRSRAIVYLANTVGMIIKTHEVEKRLDEIEKHIGGNR